MTTTPEKTPASPEAPGLSWRFRTRDLITVAIFAAIYMVITYVLGMLSLFGPLMWIVSVPVAIIVNGTTFMLFFTRVTHAGMFTLFAVVQGAFFLLHGGAPSGAAAAVVLGIVVEAIAYAGRYRARWSAIASYTIFGLTAFTPFLPMVLNRDAYFGSAAWQSMGEEFVNSADELFTLPLMGLLAAVCLLAGFIGALFGAAVLRKHFVRAGLA